MMMHYPAVLGQETVGTVDVQKIGLYYTIQANCRLSGEVPCKLIANAGDQTLDLGTFVPKDDHFCIHTKVAQKKLCNGELSFRVSTKHRPSDYPMIPLHPDEPFRYLEKMTEGFLRIVGDKMYFIDPTSD